MGIKTTLHLGVTEKMLTQTVMIRVVYIIITRKLQETKVFCEDADRSLVRSRGGCQKELETPHFKQNSPERAFHLINVCQI